jgi:hypothetical protein
VPGARPAFARMWNLTGEMRGSSADTGWGGGWRARGELWAFADLARFARRTCRRTYNRARSEGATVELVC